ncbi:MAG: TIGR03088 family PEP-CTERM/XrtA system glycosyltransferase [Colwellia sp.]|nr:TIGR03088 family PEP-CTERM/XrtA system glycosyltransferase [Colwellia sp.]
MVEFNRKPTHIVHIVYAFATGGLENGVVNIINRLPEEKYRHTIVCVTGHDNDFFARITTKNTNILDLNKPAGNGVAWLFECWKLLRKLKPDICHSRNLNALEAQLPAFLARVPYRIHGEHGWDVNDLGGSNKKYQLWRRFFKPFIHQYVALSHEAVTYLKDKINVNADNIHHICNGVDIDKFTPNKNRALLPENFANNSLIFGTVGRLAEVKNQTLLVSAFLSLWQQQSQLQDKLRLVIIGDGILLPQLKRMVTSASAEQAVWFAGRRDDVAQLMQQLDIFVLPSLAEGISNTLLEAMASGLPYVATNVGGNADLVLSQHAHSHIVNVTDEQQLIKSMAQYINAPERLVKDSDLVREHCVKNFSLEVMVEKYHQLYQKNINKGIK